MNEQHAASLPGAPVRFSVLSRLLHVAVMVGFTGLALTGFSLKFGDQAWAQAAAWVFGGAPGLGSWHRGFAVLTYGAVTLHLLWLAYYKLALKGRLTGPGTMFPAGRDLSDFAAHLRYFFARGDESSFGREPSVGREPTFGRFAYWEKLDYWAVLLGMQTMGLTGLMLWLPELFARLAPGWLINLALVLHFWEAVLAVAVKIVVHMYTAHLRPAVYPLEKSIFTGRAGEERAS